MNFQKFIENKLMPIASKTASNKYLSAIKDGFIASMPFLIVGSFVLLLVNLPLVDPNNFLYQQWYVDLMSKYKANLIQPFYVSMGIMTIFVSFGIGYSLSNSHKINGITGGLLSLFTFLILCGQSDQIPYGGDVPKWAILPGASFPIIDARYLGAQGIFTGIIVAILSVELYRFLVNRKIIIKLPESVPPAVARSFEALIPVILLTIIAQTINIAVQSTTGTLLPEIMMHIFRPMLNISDSLFGSLMIVFIIHIFWFCGIHGGALVSVFLSPISLTNLEINARALSNNLPLPHILSGGFLDVFVHIGGSGTTLGLTIAMIMSKVPHLRNIGKIALAPGIFNINEPIIFGAPIVLNPILGIPFILVPLINTTIAYSLTNFGVIERVSTLMPWTTPAALAAFISTGLDPKALILSLCSLALSVLLYLPFLKAYEKVLLRQEKTHNKKITANKKNNN
ncbi:PTS cellobiose transporter subunit IIC (plasmid) [Borrelia nietonii YOR]|uniref:PTS cellobiose transporter subunit IIC n=1 Tax=Borrelia nietonii TaxID=3117462 RepID=UPI001FF6268E|nr:PTS cellobiose transporter subunit IIC [Borrelia nietonii]UPA09857.1 PTS cellobiose transporter subunit IIC [Borrelia nietonii YOR]